MRSQNFGIEIEMTGLTRSAAARIIAGHFGTQATHVGGAYDSYAAACGVSDQVLWQMMKDNPGIRRVCLCLDHDEPGQAAARRIAEKLKEHGIPSEILVPIQKDWNEDLLFSQQEEIRCPTLQL